MLAPGAVRRDKPAMIPGPFDTPADAIATGVPATVRPRKGPAEGKPLVDPAEYVDPALWI